MASQQRRLRWCQPDPDDYANVKPDSDVNTYGSTNSDRYGYGYTYRACYSNANADLLLRRL